MTNHTVCGTGEYQNSAGQTNCDDCPAGSECSDPTVSPVSCDPGTYSAVKSTTCTQCGTGEFIYKHVQCLAEGITAVEWHLNIQCNVCACFDNDCIHTVTVAL